MADYYSILKKTITSLPESNGAARRSVYSRARNAIVNQLKAYEPPLSPSEITAEQLRLEEAIRKVEAEAARESLGLGPSAPKVDAPAAQSASVTVAASPPPPPVDAPPQPAFASAYADEDETEAGSTDSATPSPLKDTLSEAQGLGTAATMAVQSTKDVVEPSSGSGSNGDVQQRREPAFSATSDTQDDYYDEDDAHDGHHDESGHGEPELYAEDYGQHAQKQSSRRSGKSGRDKKQGSASDALKGEPTFGRYVMLGGVGLVLLILAGAAAYFFTPAGDQIAVNRSEPEPATPAPASSGEEQAAVSQEPAADGSEPSKNTDRLLDGGAEDGEDGPVAEDARPVTTTLITPESQDGGQQDAPAPPQPSIVTNVEGQSEPAAEENDQQEPAAAEEPLAVPQDNLAAVAPEDSAPAEPAVAAPAEGAQRSILYEEGEEAGGAGTAAQGAVVWTIEEETNLDGKAQKVLNASVEIPERDVRVDIRIKPNDDTSLPASHLVEIKYDFPDEFAAGDVVNVPGLVMKPTEEARGDALIGASVKVSPGFFWIALSSLPNERQRNMALLRERGWIDIPMLYENGKRGILTLEKGNTGTDVVEQAISSWQAG